MSSSTNSMEDTTDVICQLVQSDAASEENMGLEATKVEIEEAWVETKPTRFMGETICWALKNPNPCNIQYPRKPKLHRSSTKPWFLWIQHIQYKICKGANGGRE